jgi:hypothetical protein
MISKTMTEAEKSAAYSAQVDNLNLKPWQKSADVHQPR